MRWTDIAAPALLLASLTPYVHAFADEAKPTKFVINAELILGEHHEHMTYQHKPFDSKDACDEFLTSSPVFQRDVQVLLAQSSKVEGLKVEVSCVPVVPKDYITVPDQL